MLASCDTDGSDIEIDGQWDDEAEEDWTDPGAPGNESIADGCGWGLELEAHHCFLTSVHAVHMHTGHLMMFHGERDMRRWKIGDPPENMDWHPLPMYETNPLGVQDWTDLFCSGHVQLASGDILYAGGNNNGQATGGGLLNLFRILPETADTAAGAQCPFGWDLNASGGATPWVNPLDTMDYDRWYPTLTLLADGRVLISAGESCAAGVCPGAAAPATILEVYDPSTNVVTPLNEAPFPVGTFPNYPYMFLLPNGDVLYAGSENAANSDQAAGRILVPDYNNSTGSDWYWDKHFGSTIRGGSAAMPQPGLILKTGGRNFGSEVATNVTEVLDLRDYPAANYADAPDDFSIAMPMHRARHFHNLVVLPDGRVAAVGGNNYGNARNSDRFSNPCDYLGQPIANRDCEDGCPSVCVDAEGEPVCSNETHVPALRCSLLSSLSCTEDAECDALVDDAECVGDVCWKDCTTLGVGELCGMVDDCSLTTGPDGLPGGKCDPHNNECYAEKTAEIWDPTCNVWEELPAQERPRLYHSTALLLPDARVISMGGGHKDDDDWILLREQPYAEYLEPDYAADPSASRPMFHVGSSDPFGGLAGTAPPEPFLPWDGEVEVTLDSGPTPVRATLIRLGSTTHGFDQDQRLVDLDIDGAGTSYTVLGPETDVFANAGGDTVTHAAANLAPPGYYMLFLLSAAGEPSVGRYVRVGDMTADSYVCPATGSLTAVETSCTQEPQAGACPSGGVQTVSVPLPTVDGPSGSVPGFVALVPGGTVEDPASMTPAETAYVQSRCAAACNAHFADVPGQTASCDAVGAFAAPTRLDVDTPESLDLLHADDRDGSELFPGQQLSCDLGTSCYAEFDEALARAVAQRASPAEDGLGVGEEYRVALGVDSEVVVTTPGGGSYSARMTGSLGYGFCRDQAPGQPCPFYLGSFQAVTAGDISTRMTCDDGTTARETLSNLVVKLGQPAFGMADGATSSQAKAFPPGSLLFDAGFDVGRSHFTSRRPNRFPVQLDADGVTFSASNLAVSLQVPCNSSTATVTLSFSIEDPGDGSALDRPPVVAVTTPSVVSCGTTVPLSAAVTDADGDLATLRWRVDGVWMSAGTSTMSFNETHVLEAVATDARGAVTTATRTVQCQ